MRYAPERKVAAQSIGGAVATLIVLTVGMLRPELEIPTGSEGALAVVIGFVAGWLTPSRGPS